MTTTVLNAVKFVGTKVDKFRDREFLHREGKKVEEVLKFCVFLFGPILLPILLIYLEVNY